MAQKTILAWYLFEIIFPAGYFQDEKTSLLSLRIESKKDMHAITLQFIHISLSEKSLKTSLLHHFQVKNITFQTIHIYIVGKRLK
jgi:hypothetical protein